jgi:hypothetical protein
MLPGVAGEVHTRVRGGKVCWVGEARCAGEEAGTLLITP